MALQDVKAGILKSLLKHFTSQPWSGQVRAAPCQPNPTKRSPLELPMPHLLPRGGKQQPTATSAGNFEPRAQPGLAPASHNLFLAKVQGTASIGATFLSGSQQEELQRDEFTKIFLFQWVHLFCSELFVHPLSKKEERSSPAHCCGHGAALTLLRGEGLSLLAHRQAHCTSTQTKWGTRSTGTSYFTVAKEQKQTQSYVSLASSTPLR